MLEERQASGDGKKEGLSPGVKQAGKSTMQHLSKTRSQPNVDKLI